MSVCIFNHFRTILTLDLIPVLMVLGIYFIPHDDIIKIYNSAENKSNNKMFVIAI